MIVDQLKWVLLMLTLPAKDIDRIIEMAWEDRTPFEAIEIQFGLPEARVIELMRLNLKRKSFELWRKRVNSGVSQKHLKKEIQTSAGSNATGNDRSPRTK